MSSLILQRIWEYDRELSSISREFASDARIPPSIAAFLLNRGIASVADVVSHFEPSLAMLHDPFMMSGMGRAVERIIAAVGRQERIGIFGDYDADGVTATALLYLFFKRLGMAPAVYIPHRELDGYGLSRQGLDMLLSEGCSLVITVDCGVTAIDEAAYAKEKGLDLIVTDHHETAGTLPDALAVLDPHSPECGFPFRDMAGVGVAFYLAWAVRNRLHRLGHWHDSAPVNMKSFLDLVVVGTLADVVPLTGNNRVFVKRGLEVLESECRTGMAALKKAAGLVSSKVTARDVAFRLAPLLNAAGRMDHAMEAFRLLVEDDPERADGLALYLKSLNESRQKVQLGIQKGAHEMVRDMGDMPGYVLYHRDWKMGIIGIAASRLSESTGRPVLLLAPDGDLLCGSGRCPESYDLMKLLEGASMHLERFGGHRNAAGFALKPSELDAFREAFVEMCRVSGRDQAGHPVLPIDAEVSISEFRDPAYIEFLDLLEPFGPGYSAPVFSMREFSLLGSGIVGNNHLKLRIGSADSRGGCSFELLGWNRGDHLKLPWNSCEIAFEPSVNQWNGNRKIQLILRDARKRN